MNEKLIVPIKHVNESGKTVLDGTGFVANIFGESVLVTCRHNIANNTSKKHYVEIQGQKIDIDPLTDNCFGSPDLSPQPTKDEQGVFQSMVDDYIFVVLPNTYHDAIDLGTSKTVVEGDELELHSYSENGTKNRITVKRKNSNDFAVIHSKSFDFPIHCNNLIEVDSQKLEHGFSGGPVFQEGICVGMLQNGAEENRTDGEIMFGSILTAESIAMRYVKLKGS
jgi:hypothetical protein